MPPVKTSAVTIRDVARLANVSIATVSRVLNGVGQIAPETEERVRTAIATLNFVPKAAAQSLSNNKTNVIGLLLPEIDWANFFPPMLRGIEAGCYDSGFELLIHSARRFLDENRPRRPVGEHNTDGMLLFVNSIPDEEIARLHGRGFPLVLLYCSPPAQTDIPHVVFENKDGARQMVDHLIEVHAYRKIAFLAGPDDNEDAHWRERGYREALQAHGVPFDPQLVRSGGFSEQIATATMQSWLQEGFEAEAVFAADDDSAYGAIRALQAAGRRVPEDVAVVGFDDAPTSRLFTPALTTVGAPIEEAGYRAARILAERIRTGQTERQALLPTSLVLRASCGCPH